MDPSILKRNQKNIYYDEETKFRLENMFQGGVTYSEFPHHLTVIQRTNVTITRRVSVFRGVMEMSASVVVISHTISEVLLSISVA